ncbi:MAG TPA: glutathione S-transferase family protein [Steroidobacteraceae bacterium]|nr:glutathione S-transferase family protein [Steroidobacteraceae bacterium]
MILIGQFDSPFVRRVAIALRLYRLEYEHRPWSTFGDADKIVPFNPLRRVPTLVLDDGEVLIESGAILDYLDERVGPAKALIAVSGLERRQALKTCALATGLSDKVVSLIYERVLHRETSDVWIARCRSQISSVLDVLEADRGHRTSVYWFGASIGHADIAVACALRILREAHAPLSDDARWPSLAAHGQHCEALPAFQAVQQQFIPPPQHVMADRLRY